ncbi:hypothetical protein MSAN_00882400 [Mycena sanguinolenta]|uniref:DUF6534 domain-containing protein n=1 Tax=Mycena sanguinolenta TaxID=230812 RepID=A0A8H6YWL2_9AGAR|nr:hypothetical protein MSAN_00882400 [Mycena sanguinolenta]
MSTTIPRLDAIAGAPLIGTWASSLLYMAELLQAWYYFGHFKKDSWKLKSYVAVAFAIDTVSALGDCVCVYLYTITHAGDLVYLTKQNWAVPLYLISTSCVAFLVQSFLTFRYWSFTKNTIFVCFLSILILGAFSGGFSSALTIVLFPRFEGPQQNMDFRDVLSADIVIAGALLLELMRAKSLLKGRRINSLLNRLVSQTIQTGTATAVTAVLSLIAFLINDKTNVPVGIMYPLGRIYVLSMLINLNIRDSKNSNLSGGQREAFVFAHTTTQDISAQLRDTNEPHSSNRGTVKSRLPTLQPPAKISETQPPEIEMVSTDTKPVPEV